jgi:protein TonB
MLRLRTTVVLSLLGLAVGIAGTDWLSARSTNEPLAMAPVAAKRSTSPFRRSVSPVWHAHASGQGVRHRSPRVDDIAGAVLSERASVHSAPLAPPPELVPLDMPATRDLAYAQLRGHLDGRVVMRVSIDGEGHVTAANVAQSSGDPVLDAHALHSVRGWRFVVPPDHADGLSADLPMDFSSSRQPVASVR